MCSFFAPSLKSFAPLFRFFDKAGASEYHAAVHPVVAGIKNHTEQNAVFLELFDCFFADFNHVFDKSLRKKAAFVSPPYRVFV